MSNFAAHAKGQKPFASPLGVTPTLIDSGGRRVALHVSTQANLGSPPLLLIHSVNASPSVIELHAVFDRQAQRRPVVALDLPGFGASDRLAGHYSPALMVRAIQAALKWTRRHIDAEPVDVIALSLGCEFATLAALAEPGAVRSLTLISPTGMEGRRVGESYAGAVTRESRVASELLHLPRLSQGLYDALTSRPSMRWFLARSWGTRNFDPALLEHGHANARAAGARHAPLDFLAGALFTRGMVECYQRLAMPVLLAHGQRGSFTDFEAYRHIAANAAGQWQRRVFSTGAMPHLERQADFDLNYQSWLASHVESTSSRVTRQVAASRQFGPRGSDRAVDAFGATPAIRANSVDSGLRGAGWDLAQRQVRE